jgi:hypothetical protein
MDPDYAKLKMRLPHLKDKEHDGENRADHEERYGVLHKIRVGHEDHTDHEGFEIRLLFPINNSPKADAPEDDRRQNISSIHHKFSHRFLEALSKLPLFQDPCFANPSKFPRTLADRSLLRLVIHIDQAEPRAKPFIPFEII